ncbi:MAG: hypothetical protein AAGA93_12275 [Actinomycetota bacterium]
MPLTSSLTSSLSPPPSVRRRTSPGWTDRTRLGAIAVAVLAVSACAGGDPDVDTERAAEALTRIEARSDVGPGGFADLERCPHDPGGALLAETVAEQDLTAVAEAQRTELVAAVSSIGDDLPLLLSCDRFGDTSGIGLLVSSAPADFDAYLDGFLAGDGDSGADPGNDDGDDADGPAPTVDRLGTEDHRGGVLHRLCVRDGADDALDYCEVDWLDDRLLVTVYVSGATATETDLDALQAGLAGVLDEVVANLAESEGLTPSSD